MLPLSERCRARIDRLSVEPDSIVGAIGRRADYDEITRKLRARKGAAVTAAAVFQNEALVAAAEPLDTVVRRLT
jgi:hypothetical protein